ncbi:MAG: trimethylamine methyltransferase family protein [Anaerolineae bacterium]
MRSSGLGPFHAATLTVGEAQHIHETALRILGRVGLYVPDDGLRQRAAQAGIDVRGERAYPRPEMVQRHVQAYRQQLQGRRVEAVDQRILHLHPSTYHHHLLELDSGTPVPYTEESLVQMARLTDTLQDRGVAGVVPGFPPGVPAVLQPLLQYRLGAENLRAGPELSGVTSPELMEYLFDMAEVMERPIRHLPVYVYSPMRLCGESLDLVLHFEPRLEGVHVSSMPAAGATAPMEPFGALAMAAAEVLGSFALLREVTDLDVGFSVAAFPFDLRAMTMVFGTPENLLLRLACADLNAYYGHDPAGSRGLGEIYVMAKLPDAQAAAEKASLMTAAALLGERWFSGAGALCMDDLFSPVQLLIDCEVRDHVQRLIAGLDVRASDTDWAEIVEQGCREGFAGLESTAAHFRRLSWFPILFDRGPFGAWLQEQGPDLVGRARALCHQSFLHHDFELDIIKRRELQRLWQAAVQRTRDVS